MSDLQTCPACHDTGIVFDEVTPGVVVPERCECEGDGAEAAPVAPLTYKQQVVEAKGA